MTNRQTAIRFVDRFCAGDVEGLVPLLAEGLQFTGPLHRFGSRADYLASLRADPPQPSDYRILSITESHDSVSIYYDYIKADGSLTVAQLMTLANLEIVRLLLVFDTRGRW